MLAGLVPFIIAATALAPVGAGCGGASPASRGTSDGGSGGTQGNGGGGGIVAADPVCGNGIVEGDEQCDDGNTASGDGCSSTCQIEPQEPNGDGWVCPKTGGPCSKTPCGNGVAEGNKQCDDGNGLPYDGCYLCRKEPTCPNGQCVVTCGDGIVDGDEQCDDGNNISGDGCSADCKLESIPGITCSNVTSDLPDSIDVPVIYRDFKGFLEPGGHPDFEHFYCDAPSFGLVQPTLVNGKPAFAKGTTSNPLCGTDGTADQRVITSADSFAQWYVDTPGVNKTIVGSLTVSRAGPTNTYVFDSARTPLGNTTATSQLGFFPLDAIPAPTSWGLTPPSGMSPPNTALNHDYGFTTELRNWFMYRGGEVLNFTGDDDVWIFVAGRLAVDLGGTHPKSGDQPAGSPLGTIDLDSNAGTLGIVKGHVYEMALFHAERHTVQSNFKLTLGGFAKTTTKCASVCGDGVKAPDEECDDGPKNGTPGDPCSATCKLLPMHPQ